MAKSSAKPQQQFQTPERDWIIGRGLLAQSLMLEEQGPERLIRFMAIFVGLIILAGIAWTTQTTVKEVSVASGEVSPTGSVLQLQHLEGGIVKELNVREGDLVDEGQVVLVLEPSTSLPELNQLRTRLAGLEFQAERLRAFAEGRDADFQDDGQYAELAKNQIQTLTKKNASIEAQSDVILRQIEQRKGDLALLRNQERSSRRQIDILKEQVAMRSELAEKGLTSKVVLLNDQRVLARAEGQLQELIGQRAVARNAIREAEGRVAELETRTEVETQEELSTITSEIAELRQTIKQTEDRVTRLVMRAPASGVVQEVSIQRGNVISPGGTVLSMIPSDAELIVEARIMPQDIGFVREDMAAGVKVTSYDYTRYGEIDGSIENISATTIEDEDGTSYYRARVKLAKNYVGEDPTKNIVVPGMEIIADIQTGEKKVIEYLLKPVYRSLSEAFRER